MDIHGGGAHPARSTRSRAELNCTQDFAREAEMETIAFVKKIDR